ncbi:AraC family transcriptional regulator [Rhodoferax lacus]|uniref:AraC family transcriptional regulator n=1 Tax=Rhodoferax lacus TaxID=2184758 RepID=A0A3E1R8H0_9BURK|nr:GlxA family transcriptional regulator [Rhodoferax lacus]RFO95668.1 AraC family transcriptional regulator [Rhodoferax lacus]
MKCHVFDFLLLPEFSFIGFAALVEPLRIANRFKPGAYDWRMVSQDGLPVVASNGIALHPQARLSDASAASVVFAIASFNPLADYSPALGRQLQQRVQQGMTLGAIDTGCFVLAEAHLLKGERITLHWEAVPAFQERYPLVAVQGEARFTLSPTLMTSAGAMASVDLMLEVITRDHGNALALQVSEQLVSGWVRERADHQRLQIAARYKVHNAKVVQVIGRMEQHLESPLSSDALAEPLGVTRRQLERLFQEHLAVSPLQLYLRLRLERARHLLRQTSMGVIEVGLACGFGSASAFSRAYRRQYAVAPSDDRRE